MRTWTRSYTRNPIKRLAVNDRSGRDVDFKFHRRNIQPGSSLRCLHRHGLLTLKTTDVDWIDHRRGYHPLLILHCVQCISIKFSTWAHFYPDMDYVHRAHFYPDMDYVYDILFEIIFGVNEACNPTILQRHVSQEKNLFKSIVNRSSKVLPLSMVPRIWAVECKNS